MRTLAAGWTVFGFLALAWSASAGTLALDVRDTGQLEVDVLIDFDEDRVDQRAKRAIASNLGVDPSQVADPVQALFRAGLIVSWESAAATYSDFVPAAPAVDDPSFRLICGSALGCAGFDPSPEAGRSAVGVAFAGFDGITTNGEALLGTLVFDKLGGDPLFVLDQDEQDTFAGPANLLLLDLQTFQEIDLATGQPTPSGQQPGESSLAQAVVEPIDATSLDVEYLPEPGPHVLQLCVLAMIAAKRGASQRTRA